MSSKKGTHKIYLYSIGIVLFIALHYALKLDFFDFLNDKAIVFLRKISFTLAVVCIILLIKAILDRLIVSAMDDRGEKYNLLRVTKLISIILIFFAVLFLIFNENPYSFITGLGVASLILGFALQTPITSFIAWLYVIFRKPFRVGDRVQITDHRGDVIEINYLDTIIRECSGDYLGNDHESGRLIHFPNSLILTDKIINYSGRLSPYIWNETGIQISYTSDLKFVESCLMEAATRDFKERYPQRAKENKKEWHPNVYFRINQYAWVEAVISYPVEPTDTTGRRNRILRQALPLLNEQPEKVQFPEGTRR